MAKREWCCRQPGNKDITCPGTESAGQAQAAVAPVAVTTTRTYDCDLGWRQLWSHNQAAWCCFHLERGCPTTTSGAPTLSVQVVISNDAEGHAGAVKADESPSPYNCLVTYANREKFWTPEKRDWCCKHRGAGCSGAGLTSRKLSWSPFSSAWALPGHLRQPLHAEGALTGPRSRAAIALAACGTAAFALVLVAMALIRAQHGRRDGHKPSRIETDARELGMWEQSQSILMEPSTPPPVAEKRACLPHSPVNSPW